MCHEFFYYYNFQKCTSCQIYHIFGKNNIFTFICDIGADKHSLRKKIDFYIFLRYWCVWALLCVLWFFSIIITFRRVIIFKSPQTAKSIIFLEKIIFLHLFAILVHISTHYKRKLIFYIFLKILMRMSTFRRFMIFFYYNNFQKCTSCHIYHIFLEKK